MQKLELSLDNENTNSSQVSYLKHFAVYYTKPVSCGNLMQRNHNVLNTINYLNKTCFRHFYTPVPRCLGSNFVVNKPTNGITLLSKILKFLLSYTSVKIFIWIIFSIKLTFHCCLDISWKGTITDFCVLILFVLTFVGVMLIVLTCRFCLLHGDQWCLLLFNNNEQVFYDACKFLVVVSHIGVRAIGGHYIVDVFHPGYNCWLRCDDNNIASIPTASVTKFNSPKVPYLIFYRCFERS